MTRNELRKYLDKKKLGAVILVCPRCSKVDIDPRKHADECSIEEQAWRHESDNNFWKD